jgi:pyruvate dehydrogenase E1 component alpha subunit
MIDLTLTERLGRLANPNYFQEKLALGSTPVEILFGYLRSMIVIRKAEEAIAGLVESGEAKCPCHLSIGQEAIPVGISAHLRSSDRVFGGHRSHGHYLALGSDMYGLIAEVLGRASGCAGGRGGSMHLQDQAHGFIGSVPIVGETVPIAVGAALAAQMDGGDAIAVAYFGDGATEEGQVQEAFNLASVMRLPILFVCENNLYSSHLDIGMRQPSEYVARFAEAHRMPNCTIDGNDVVGVANSACDLIGRIRAGEGPAFIEAITYRWRGHVGPREDIDVGIRRGIDQLAKWKKRDPIRRLASALQDRGALTPAELLTIEAEVEVEIDQIVTRAIAAPLPQGATLLDHVFSPARKH